MVREVRSVHGRTYLYEVAYAWNARRRRSEKKTLRYLGPCDASGQLVRRPRMPVESLTQVEPVGALAVFHAQAQELDLVDWLREALSLSTMGANVLVALALDNLTGPRALPLLERWIRTGPMSHWDPTLREARLGVAVSEVRNALRRSHLNLGDPGPTLVAPELLSKVWRSRRMTQDPEGAYCEVWTRCELGPGGARNPDPWPIGTPTSMGFGMHMSKGELHPTAVDVLPPGMDLVERLRTTAQRLEAEGRGGVLFIDPEGRGVFPALGAILASGNGLVGHLEEPTSEDWDTLIAPQRASSRTSRRPVTPSTATASGFQVASHLGTRLGLAAIVLPDWREREVQERGLLLEEWSRRTSDPRRKELSRQLGRILVPSRGRRGARMNASRLLDAELRDGKRLIFSTDPSLPVPTALRLLSRGLILQQTFPPSDAVWDPWPLRYGERLRQELFGLVGFLGYLIWTWTERRLTKAGSDASLLEVLPFLSQVHAVAWRRTGEELEWATPLEPTVEELLRVFGGLRYVPGATRVPAGD